MKILTILFAVLFLGFLAIQIFTAKSQRNIETHTYAILEKYNSFEIRKYEATLFTTVNLRTKNYKKASTKGFSLLAGYIFGNNKRNEKIAMTSPVTMSLGDSITMMFMVPKKYKRENLPEPVQSEIQFRKEPARKVAALTFGGWANDAKIARYKKQLTTALKREGIVHTGQFYFLGYNPPYEVFQRKNEVLVELTTDALDLISKKKED
jgi:hypothetical protein